MHSSRSFGTTLSITLAAGFGASPCFLFFYGVGFICWVKDTAVGSSSNASCT